VIVEGADVSGIVSEGGQRFSGIHHTPRAKPKPVKRGPKIAPRDVVTAAAQAFARNEIDRAELMRRITPSQSR
jgi:hypothetical protein